MDSCGRFGIYMDTQMCINGSVKVYCCVSGWVDLDASLVHNDTGKICDLANPEINMS